MRKTTTPTWYPGAVATGRIVIGIIFLWAGLEKVIGNAGVWTAKGFLAFGTAGTLGWPFVMGAVAQGTIFNPTHDLWVNLAANDAAVGFINFLVQFGEVAIGLALIFGVLTRFAAAAGTLMMLLFFFAAWDFAYGIVNQHLTYAVATFGLAVVGAGNYYGIDARIGDRLPAGVRRWLASGETTGA